MIGHHHGRSMGSGWHEGSKRCISLMPYWQARHTFPHTHTHIHTHTQQQQQQQQQLNPPIPSHDAVRRYENTDGMKEMDGASVEQRSRIEAAEHRMAQSRQKFARLHAVCVAGEQGLRRCVCEIERVCVCVCVCALLLGLCGLPWLLLLLLLLLESPFLSLLLLPAAAAPRLGCTHSCPDGGWDVRAGQHGPVLP